jgi:hypothetical protein
MQKQTNRQIVAAVLIAAGVLGGFFVFSAHRRVAAAANAAAGVSTTIDRMIATAGDLASAQQAYVAPGQPDQPWLERSAMLLQKFGEDAAAIRPEVQSVEAAGALEQIDQEFKAVVVINQKARQYRQQGQNLLAADLIFSEGRDTIAMLTATLRNLRAAEQLTADAGRASAEYQQWGVLAVVLLTWIAGIVLLTPLPQGDVLAPPTTMASTAGGAASTVAEAAAPSMVDLAAAADVCSQLAHATDAAALRDVLARLAHVLDARGIVVWMGAGEELFPALSFGYDERIVTRMGPIARGASNATADAWRTGQVRTVTSDIVSHGAVAAPVAGVTGCVGVLAAEVMHGREQDPSTCAVAAMFASQLSAVVSAWPAASSAKSPESGPIAASAK